MVSLIVTEGIQTNQQHTISFHPWNGIAQNFHLQPSLRLPRKPKPMQEYCLRGKLDALLVAFAHYPNYVLRC